ncbi:MAG TPA: DUF3857 domain-containing protein, partial [Candidatus Acidoferrales bacterium]|nr:DUF3857 domain-containing protein [Candidatus Acidoferrales bacterium]
MQGPRCFVASALLAMLTLLAAFMPPAAPAADEWLPIDPADLALKDNPASPGSHAMILYREEHTDSEQSFVAEYLRIKIFTEEGKKYGDIEIPFVKGQSDVKNVRARTIRPDGSIVNFDGKPFEKVVVKAGGIKVLEKTFSLPDVQPGCIIEYKYRLQYDSFFYWNVSWEVQQDLFTREAKFSIKPPLGANSPGLYWQTIGLEKDLKLQKEKDGSYALDMQNVSGVQREEYSLPDSMLHGRVDFFFVFGPPKTPQQFWKDTAKAWNDDIDKFVNKKAVLNQLLTQTVSATDSPETKLQKIYARVQQIRNVSYEDKTQQEEKREKLKVNNNVDDLLKHGYGTSGQINWLFLGLARAADFTANELYVVPRSQGIFHEGLEDARQLSADVVQLQLGTHEVYLDPASKYYPYGVLPWSETDARGLLVNKEGGGFVTVPTPQSEDSTSARHVSLQLATDGSATGTLVVNYTGMWASAIRYDERNEDDTGRRKDMADEIKAWLPADSKFEITKTSTWDASSEPLQIEGTLALPSYATSAGTKILVPITPFIAPEPRAFQSAMRTNSIYFRYPYQQHDEIELKLPAGYQVESLPSPTQISSGAIQYSISMTKQPSELGIQRALDEKGIVYDVKFYGTIRQIFNTVKS